MAWGTAPAGDGVSFRVWAPSAERVELALGEARRTMQREGDGWWACVAPAAAGDRYRFVVDGDAVADPAARAMAGGLWGEAVIVDPGAYPWRATGWRGRPWEETVIEEIHVGTFTAEGTFRAAIERLGGAGGDRDHRDRADAGGAVRRARGAGATTGCCSMPRTTAYGTPDDLRALVDAAHEAGLMVFLDVVYNHFGPEGNPLGRLAPEFFHPERSTPWGIAIAYETPAVRRFFIDNALYWLDEFRFDGLRFDAADHVVRCGLRGRDPRRDGARGAGAVPGSPCPPGDRGQPQHRRAASVGGRPAAAPHGRVERRSPQRRACRRDRGDRGLLRRLRRGALGEARAGARRGLRLPGRAVAARGRGAAGRGERGAAAARLHRLHPEPRPDRQPRLRRAADGAGARADGAGADGDPAAVAARAAAVHGAGVGREAALRLLLRLRGRPRRLHPRGTAGRVRALRRLPRPRRRAPAFPTRTIRRPSRPRSSTGRSARAPTAAPGSTSPRRCWRCGTARSCRFSRARAMAGGWSPPRPA